MEILLSIIEKAVTNLLSRANMRQIAARTNGTIPNELRTN